MDRAILEQYAEYLNKQKGRPYPCSNQIVVCGVIIKDRQKALSIMEQKGAILISQCHDRIRWILNGEFWLWRNWNTGYRGYRFYKMLVDKNIDERMFHWATAYGSLYCCSMEII